MKRSLSCTGAFARYPSQRLQEPSTQSVLIADQPEEMNLAPAIQPLSRQSRRSALGHLHQGQRLSCGDQQAAVALAMHFEGTPEACLGQAVQPTLDPNPVSQLGGSLVIDFCSGEYGKQTGSRHFQEIHAHGRGKSGSAGFDHPQVGEIVDHPTAVGVEEHDLLSGFQNWYFSGHVGRKGLFASGVQSPRESNVVLRKSAKPT